VTDANLVLGLLDPEAELAGGVALDLDAARRAVGELARRLELDDDACARGIVRVANTEMTRALRVMTVERGVDPRGYALLAFGGAGGLHAAAIADELGIDRILCPRASGVLSALGLAVAERRADARRTVLGGEVPTDELADEARAALGDDDAELRVAHDLRYRGQSFELTVPAGDDARAAFEDAHEERYGYREPDAEVELVTVRVSAVRPGPQIDLTAGAHASEPAGARATTLGADTTIFTGELGAGTELEGPAVWQGPEATLAVPEGWRGRVDDAGTVVLERWTR
jgi:N-methylhydantoinase A